MKSYILKRRKIFKKMIVGMTLMGMPMIVENVYASNMSHGADNFYASNKVIIENIKFKNIFGMEIVGNLYKPIEMNANEKYPALVVGHPFAAVRQQSANLYATKMAEQGFVTLSFDQVFWGDRKSVV